MTLQHLDLGFFFAKRCSGNTASFYESRFTQDYISMLKFMRCSLYIWSRIYESHLHVYIKEDKYYVLATRHSLLVLNHWSNIRKWIWIHWSEIFNLSMSYRIRVLYSLSFISSLIIFLLFKFTLYLPIISILSSFIVSLQ